MVYVISKTGKPLMPTNRHGKVRHLLKSGLAKVVQSTPFTIQLLYDSKEYTQPITLGVDAGYKNIGLSAITDKKELFSAEVTLRDDISALLAERAMYRHNRRSRLWHRPAKFDNRTKPENWLAPSIQHKLDSHIRLVEKLSKILPITNIVVEVANFDIQKINNPDIAGVDYQNGVQKGFWNTREYVLYRDGHVCQACKGKSKDSILNVHHIIPRSQGGTNKPDNLITLCETCHKKLHSGQLKIEIPKPSKQFKAETFMSMVRWMLVNKLKELGYAVTHTYGYITKNNRIALGLPKTHANDAFCIAGGKEQERATQYYLVNQYRRNNRCLQINRKGYKPSIRRQRYALQPHDIVIYKGTKYAVKGIHSLGKYIKLATLPKPKSVRTDQVKLLKYGKGFQFTLQEVA